MSGSERTSPQVRVANARRSAARPKCSAVQCRKHKYKVQSRNSNVLSEMPWIASRNLAGNPAKRRRFPHTSYEPCKVCRNAAGSGSGSPLGLLGAGAPTGLRVVGPTSSTRTRTSSRPSARSARCRLSLSPPMFRTCSANVQRSLSDQLFCHIEKCFD